MGDCVRDLGGGREIAELRGEFVRFALVAVCQNDALAALYEIAATIVPIVPTPMIAVVISFSSVI